MLPDRVSNPGHLTYESGALPIALCGPATSIEIMDRLHAILRPHHQYFSHTGRCEGDIMKG